MRKRIQETPEVEPFPVNPHSSVIASRLRGRAAAYRQEVKHLDEQIAAAEAELVGHVDANDKREADRARLRSIATANSARVRR